jgi:hypothetical protein
MDDGGDVVAMAKKKPKGLRTVLQLKATEEFEKWLQNAVEYGRLTLPIFVEHALIAHAKTLGYEVPAPPRIPKPH